MAMNIGQPSTDAVVIERELFVVQAEQVQRCCMKVVDCDRVLRRFASKFI